MNLPAPDPYGPGSSVKNMELELGLQIRALLLAVGLGVLLGLLYDALRPLRRKTGSFCAAALDILFCVAAGAAVFVYAMGADSGRLGLWELSATLLGFLLYMYTVSSFFFGIFSALLVFFCRFVNRCKNIFSHLAVSAKKRMGRMREYLRKLKFRKTQSEEV